MSTISLRYTANGHPSAPAVYRETRADGSTWIVCDGETVDVSPARAAVLASLATVDCVTVFDEETPLELIRLFQPEVLVKGADYTVETVVGADIVQGYGGQVRLAELLPGNSTTATVARMKG